MDNYGQQLDFRLRIHTLKLVTTATGYVTRVIDSFDVGRNDMEYRAEGNANIVLAIPQRCQVLRLPKLTKRYWAFIQNYSFIRAFQAKETKKETTREKNKQFYSISAGLNYHI